MINFRVLCGRSSQLTAFRSPLLPSGARAITMKIVKPEDNTSETPTERNIRLKRELSPHLLIYQPQLTSILSITHRMTGMALSGYAGVLGIGCLVLPHDFSYYMTMIEGLHLSSPTLMALKFILAFPATYHTVNGVRHLLWDTGRFLKISEVYSTGWAMVGVATTLAAVFAAM